MAIISAKDAKKYFNYPIMRKYLIYSVILTLIAGLIAYRQNSALVWLVAIVFLAVAIIIYMIGIKGVATDQDIEESYGNFAIRINDPALEALNLTKNDLVRNTDWFWSVSNGIGDYPKRYRTGADKVIRANTRAFLLVLYAENQIMSYEVDYNIERDAQSTSNNSEWFYKDVVGVEVGPDDRGNNLTPEESKTKCLSLGFKQGTKEFSKCVIKFQQKEEMFILRTSGGAKYFPLSNRTADDKADGDVAKKVMNSIRAMLREKKQ